jgi:hypothetical protein
MNKDIPNEIDKSTDPLPEVTPSSYFDIFRKEKPKAKPPKKDKSYYKKFPLPPSKVIWKDNSK